MSSADTSVADILFATPAGAHRIGAVPIALHDAGAAALGDRIYVFGGGEPSRDQILAVGPNGVPVAAGRLPVAASDVAAASVGATAYIVGGYTGAQPLDTIVAWNGSGTGKLVARLPKPLRYAAVASVRGQVIIAAGTNGIAASRSVYAFDPSDGRVAQIALLPRALAHASAVSLGSLVYVIGGRGATDGTQTDEILAIDPASGRVANAGNLPVPVSDTGAAAVDSRIIVAGGREVNGTVSDQLVILTPRAS